jgi:predicted dithiol-disulfide oxidoreductase (DUF899 family)
VLPAPAAAEPDRLPAARQDYVFDTDSREQTLRELFDGRSQLVVYHFMFGPEWTEGCQFCSFWAYSSTVRSSISTSVT